MSVRSEMALRGGIGSESIRVRRAFTLLGGAFLVLTLGLGTPVAMRHGLMPGLLLGVLAAVFWLLVAGTLRLAWFRGQAIRALRTDGGRPPAGPRAVAVISGRLRCKRDPVVAPLSERRALAWEYELKGPLPDVSESAEWSGAAQAECFVETESGPVPVRCGLLLDGLEWETHLIRHVGRRFDRLVAENPFASIDGWGGAGRLMDAIDEALADGDGFRWDVRRRIRRSGARRRSARERVLEEGERVTCVGPYQPDKGLLPLQEIFFSGSEELADAFWWQVATAAIATLIFGLTQILYIWAVFGTFAAAAY